LTKDNKKIIDNFLTDKEDMKNIVLHIKQLFDKGIIILDIEYKFLGIGVNKKSLERYLTNNNIIESKVKYTVTILIKLLKNYIQNHKLCLIEEDISDRNRSLVDLLKEKIIDDKLINKVLFEFNCLSNKLDLYSDQIISKEINSHNIKSALIKCTIKKALTEESQELSFEIDKKSLSELIESLKELHEKL